MSTILVLKTSVLGDASISNQLVDEALALIKGQNSATLVTTRDLASDPVPHLSMQAASVIRGARAANEAQAAAQSLSDQLIAEVKAADTIVVGAPMYNFGMTSSLKSWFDHVLRGGVTFQYGESGPEGLVKGKRAILILTRGGLYSEGPAQAMDSQEPHIRTLLNFIGVTDIAFVRAEKLAFGPEHSEQALRQARFQIEKAVIGAVADAA